ncbi:MAG: CdaR family protein [Atribacterota bacterium]|nr:CdaR family protein [Atribacterota bacterium]MDD4896962.1 CdaR family protein [Atribacterota bacterium]MDD5636395.1 CdaR family protein [Atribacterota bacterium]
MNKIQKWITNNLDIKILALFMAVILWFYISSEYNIMSEKYYDIEVIPINLRNSLSIKEIRERVSVGIKGPQNIIENITASRIIGTVNLQNILEDGEYLIDVNVIPPRNTEIVKIIPADVRIILEKIISKEYLIEYNLIGLPERGYSLKDEPEIIPKNVFITVPESIHKIIDQVRIDIDISAINKNINREENVIVYAKDNAVLNNLKINPEKVFVSIQVREGYPEKILEIKPRIIGKPAPGFYISKIEANPNSFNIYGEYTKIINIDFLETIPIDVNGISKTLTVKVPPIMTEGIYLAENQETLVEVQIQVEEREEEKIFQNIKIEPREASPFINFQLIPETADVTISGKTNIIKNIKEEDIKIFVNLSDIGIETAQVQAEIPSDVNLVSIIPKDVSISIKK